MCPVYCACAKNISAYYEKSTYITVEPVITDPLYKGQCIKYLFIKDKALVPNFTLLHVYKLYIKKPLKADNLSIMDNSS